jgi:hypothetical protein
MKLYPRAKVHTAISFLQGSSLAADTVGALLTNYLVGGYTGYLSALHT